MAIKLFQKKWPARGKIFYAGIILEKNNFYVCLKCKADKNTIHKSSGYSGKKPEAAVKEWLDSYSKTNSAKIIAAGIEKSESLRRLESELWLKMDIVPRVFQPSSGSLKIRCRKLCDAVMKEFDKNNLARIKIGPLNRVKASRLTDLAEYEKKAEKKEFAALSALARECREKNLKIAFFNSTAAGGGVALMRHALIRLYDLLGVKAQWHVMESDEEIFQITKKKFHNILQGVAGQEIKLSEKDKKIYGRWIGRNAKLFEPVFKNADVVVIDDPQPCGLIPYIKKINPKTKIIYRSHIEIRSDLIDNNIAQQKTTWNFIWKNIKMADLFISHPIGSFVPACVNRKKLAYMPAATDLLDGLNKDMDKSQMAYYFSLFNDTLEKNNQTPLDLNRPYLAQIARFDPSKGIPHVIEAFKKLRVKMLEKGISKKDLPQLVIAGNGAIDDPEGNSLFAETIQILNMDTYKSLAGDVKAARLPHNDQLLNTLLRGSAIALQLSLREGFEIKVTEALEKGKPVIAYRTGGIPLQISHGETGYLTEPGNTSMAARHAYRLLSDKKLYAKMSKNAAEKINHDYFTVNNASKWLYLSLCLHNNISHGKKHLSINSIFDSMQKKAVFEPRMEKVLAR